MSYFVVDVESDGPIPGDYSMISFAAIKVDVSLDCHFYREVAPISDRWIPDALAVSGISRDDSLKFKSPHSAMQDFMSWIERHSVGEPRFLSDNNGYDWMFIAWYFHHFCGRNPFGYSSTNIGSLYKGMEKTMKKNFKHLRITPHTHDPLDDVKGNAEALLAMKKQGLEIDLT